MAIQTVDNNSEQIQSKIELLKQQEQQIKSAQRVASSLESAYNQYNGLSSTMPGKIRQFNSLINNDNVCGLMSSVMKGDIPFGYDTLTNLSTSQIRTIIQKGIKSLSGFTELAKYKSILSIASKGVLNSFDIVFRTAGVNKSSYFKNIVQSEVDASVEKYKGIAGVAGRIRSIINDPIEEAKTLHMQVYDTVVEKYEDMTTTLGNYYENVSSINEDLYNMDICRATNKIASSSNNILNMYQRTLSQGLLKASLQTALSNLGVNSSFIDSVSLSDADSIADELLKQGVNIRNSNGYTDLSRLQKYGMLSYNDTNSMAKAMMSNIPSENEITSNPETNSNTIIADSINDDINTLKENIDQT